MTKLEITVLGREFEGTVYTPREGVTVGIDGTSGITDKDGHTTLTLPAGEYFIKLEKTGYETTSAPIRVLPASMPLPIEVYMGNKIWPSPPPNMAMVVVTMFEGISEKRLEGVLINIDGNSGTTDQNGQFMLPLPLGEYVLKMNKTGYEEDTFPFRVYPSRIGREELIVQYLTRIPLPPTPTPPTPGTECYKGVIIHIDDTGVWTKGVGGEGKQRYDGDQFTNSLQQAKQYIDTMIGSGWSFNQCKSERGE